MPMDSKEIDKLSTSQRESIAGENFDFVEFCYANSANVPEGFRFDRSALYEERTSRFERRATLSRDASD